MAYGGLKSYFYKCGYVFPDTHISGSLNGDDNLGNGGSGAPNMYYSGGDTVFTKDDYCGTDGFRGSGGGGAASRAAPENRGFGANGSDG
jgi:hypothetical protein